MANNWYQDLNGKKIIVNNQGNTLCIISGFDYDFGITIQEKKSKRYIFCYRGPSAKIPNYSASKRNHKHRKYMTIMAKKLRKNKINSREMFSLYFKIVEEREPQQVSTASIYTCSFSQ